MNQRTFFLIILAFISLMLTSCSNISLDESSILEKYKNKLIFFSNDSNYMNESEYYDALLDLTEEYPSEITNLEIFTSSDNQSEFNIFHIKKTPALFVLSEKGIIAKVSGSKVTKQEIKDTIFKALNRKN